MLNESSFLPESRFYGKIQDLEFLKLEGNLAIAEDSAKNRGALRNGQNFTITDWRFQKISRQRTEARVLRPHHFSDAQ
jgi:hypothetical protein